MMKKTFGLIIILLLTLSCAFGQHDLYNKNKQITKTGTFKNNRLWDGKSYTYDKNNNLVKIEFYKNGCFVRDSVVHGTSNAKAREAGVVYYEKVPKSNNTKDTTGKVIGKWIAQKLIQYSADNKVQTYENRDTLLFRSDFTYVWSVLKERISGDWELDNAGKLFFRHDKVTDLMSIQKLKEDSLVLRFFDCNTKNDIDLFFNRSK
jgi:hypothetical protein